MSQAEQSSQAALLRRAAMELKSLQSKLDALEVAKREPIAIIGIGCRFPGGADDPEAFWRVLEGGVDAVRVVPRDRWDADAYYDPNPRAPGKTNTRHGGFLDRVDEFDPYFFGISPRECASMDPQQRLFLETSWEALEDAGQAVDQLRGSLTGVFVGAFNSDFAMMQQAHPERIDVYGGAGGLCAIPGRLSFLLDLRGPSVSLDTACSSSLVAIHLACQSLRNGESTLAVVGGVSVMLSPIPTTALSNLLALAPDGRCKAFDASADGMGRGEGCGVVILKRLSDAIRDGDRIRAVICGSAVNHDGASTSFTSPNVLAQQAVIRKALADAGVEPSDVGFIESHGTGTSLGDPIEMEALKATYGRPRKEGDTCAIGALKTNMGHLEAAAGIAGLVKIVLSMEHEAIPPNLHFKKLNPHISLDKTPFVLPTTLRPWPRGARRRLGAASSFGLSGTNAHVILAEAPRADVVADTATKSAEGPLLLPLSARSPAALRALAKATLELLERPDAGALHDLCYTASVRRTHHDHRLAVVGSNGQAMREQLAAFLRDEPAQGLVSGTISAGSKRGVVFVFAPHGSQWLGMGRKLLEEPVFRETIERCDKLMAAHVDWSLLDRLTQDGDGSWLERIDVLQPVLFAIQVALAALVQSYGVKPDAVVGHSMGEVAAAHVSGALCLEDAVRITCRRSRLLRTVSGQGAMAVVELSLDAARQAIASYGSRLAIAVSNSPRSTVISGEPDALEELLEHLESQGIFCGWGVADVASHSPQMEAVCAALLNDLSGIEPRPTAIPFYSTVSGEPVSGAELGPGYWVQNLKRTVLFSSAVQRLIEDGLDIFLELAPHPVLAPAIEDSLRHLDRPGTALAAMRRAEEPRAVLLRSLASIYTLGGSIAWKVRYPAGGRCVKMPSYPWQRERFPLESSVGSSTAPRTQSRLVRRGSGHPLLGERRDASSPPNTFYWDLELSADSFPYLDDHRIQQSVVLPAVAFLELASAGARELFKTTALLLERVRFEKMLVIPEGAAVTLQLVITASSPEEAEFRLASRASDGAGPTAPWSTHAHGVIRLADAATSQPASLEAIRARCSETLDGNAIYGFAEEHDIQLGPSFRGITNVSLSRTEKEGLARIRTPETVAADAAAYQAHPAVLDACLQALGGIGMLLGNSKAIYLPSALGSIRLHAPLGDEIWSHARVRADEGESGRRAFEGDVDVVDGEGRILIEARSVRFQHFDAVRADAPDDRLHVVQWRDKPLAKAATSGRPATAGSWLIFRDKGGVGDALRSQLLAQGERCILVTHGEVYKAEKDAYEISPARPEDFQRLLADALNEDVPPCRGVLFLWPLDAERSEDLTLASLQAAEDLGCVATMHLVQALVHVGFRDVPRLWLVTRGAQPAADTPHPLAIAQASVWSLGRTLRHEHPELGCAAVDLDPKSEADDSATALLDVIRSDDGEDQIALRASMRRVARIVRQPSVGMTGDAAPTVHADATYLITGGFSGLGLCVAEWLTQQGARNLVLVSRRGASSEAQVVVDRLVAAGASVVTRRADVSNERELSALLDDVKRTMPPLKGVIHSAVTLDDGVILRQTRERFRKAVAAKMEGAFLLHRLTAGLPLDFFVLFSSFGSLVSQPGDASYGASNTFVDALAHHRRAIGLPGLSISWGPWTSVGLGAAQSNRGERVNFRGVSSITPEEGVETFGRLLGAPVAHVGVARLDLRQYRQFYPKIAGSPLLAELAQADRSSTESSNKAKKLLAELRAATANERRERLEALVREQIIETLRLDPSRITIETPLSTLGFDSLMAVELRNRLEAFLGVDLPVTLVWGYPTIAAIVPHLARKIGASLDATGPAAPTPSPKDDGVLSTLIGEIEQLSDENALSLLTGSG